VADAPQSRAGRTESVYTAYWRHVGDEITIEVFRDGPWHDHAFHVRYQFPAHASGNVAADLQRFGWAVPHNGIDFAIDWFRANGTVFAVKDLADLEIAKVEVTPTF
jgi:hypothetical protein